MILPIKTSFAGLKIQSTWDTNVNIIRMHTSLRDMYAVTPFCLEEFGVLIKGPVQTEEIPL